MNYEILEDEVILYEGKVGYNKNSLNTLFILTSKKMIFEKEIGLLKKTKELLDIIYLNDIKQFNGEIQSKQKLNEIQIQTISKNFSIYLSGMIEAKKVNSKIISASSGTTIAERGSEKIKGALGLVDETLGIDVRGITKGVVENGIKGTLINGIKKNKK